MYTFLFTKSANRYCSVNCSEIVGYNSFSDFVHQTNAERYKKKKISYAKQVKKKKSKAVDAKAIQRLEGLC
jgi:hypothetical protein